MRALVLASVLPVALALAPSVARGQRIGSSVCRSHSCYDADIGRYARQEAARERAEARAAENRMRARERAFASRMRAEDRAWERAMTRERRRVDERMDRLRDREERAFDRRQRYYRRWD